MSHTPENNFNDNQDFGLPGGYFQKSAGDIVNKIEWIEEHKGFVILAALKDQSGFIVPADYFLNKEQQLELLDYPVLSSLQKQAAFTTPTGYFEEAEVKELSKVMADAEPELNLGLKQNNFKVDADYFINNQKQLEQLLLKKSEAKIIGLFASKAWMAAAAVLVLALGLWLYNYYAAPVQLKDCGTMACIDKADLLKTKNLENLETDELYELVNSKKLEQELEKKSGDNKQPEKTDTVKEKMIDELLDEI